MGNSVRLNETSNHSVVDSGVSLLDLEESVVTPLVVPGVSAQPVWSTVLNSPSNDLDGMSSKGSSSGVLVDSRLVGQEVLVDGEGSLDGSVSEDLLLDLFNSSDRVRALSEVLVVVVGVAVSRNTLSLAGWGWVLWQIWAWGEGSVDVVVAWWEGVWLAVSRLVVEVSGDQSVVDPISPGGRGVSSVASLSAEESAAGEQVLGGDLDLAGLVGGNAESVAHGLSSSESPAGSAVRLVSNFLDGLALWPLGSGVEVLWEVSVDGLFLFLWELDPFWLLEGSQKSLDIIHGLSNEVLVNSSGPGGLWQGVDVLNDWG